MSRLNLLIIALFILSQEIKAQTPSWSSNIPFSFNFSSPRAADLNGDDIKDIVVGGGMEMAPSAVGVLAFDGDDGSELWRRNTRDQVFSSALFNDINYDGTVDVFVAGRGGVFLALDGTDGSVIWEVDTGILPDLPGGEFLNFYTPALVLDQNADGILDLVNIYGGYPPALASDTIRPGSFLYCFSGSDGSVLAMDTVPEDRESYNSPLAIDLERDGNTQIIFGSGGETLAGKLWKANLADLMSGVINSATALAEDSLKGFITVPSLVDLTGDGKFEIIAPVFNGGLKAFEANTDSVLWEINLSGTENYVSPAIGLFTGDPTPDVVAIFSKGIWPNYDSSFLILIDGSDGSYEYIDTLIGIQLANGNALNWDADASDELLLIENTDTGSFGPYFRNRFVVYDFDDDTKTIYGGIRDGSNVFNTPLINDIDDDGFLDIIYSYAYDTTFWYTGIGYTIDRIETGIVSHQVSWSSYLGSNFNGTYSKNVLLSTPPPSNLSLSIYPNPTSSNILIESEEEIQEVRLMDIHGKTLIRSVHKELDVSYLISGIYLIEVNTQKGFAATKFIKE